MNEATATPPAEGTTPESTPPEGTPPENNSNGGIPAAVSPDGLLSGSSTPDPEGTPPEGTPPEGTAPEVTPVPGEVPKRPAHIAAQFWDEVKGEVLPEAMGKAYNDLRKQFNKLNQEKGEVPETPEDYLKDWLPPHRTRAGEGEKEGKEFTRYGELQTTDPVFQALAKAAKKNNLTAVQFKEFTQDIMEDLHGILPDPFDAQAELGKLGEAGPVVVETNLKWMEHLHKNGVLNEDQFNHLRGVGKTALGVEVVNILRLNSGEKPIPLNASVNSGVKTQDEVNAMVADPLYKKDGPDGDAFRAKVDLEFAKTFGTEEA